MPFSATVLYTKHLVKKQKTYHDGTLTVDPAGSACLLDEAQQTLSRATAPASADWRSGTEGEASSLFHVSLVDHQALPRYLPVNFESSHAGIDCFEGYLVNIDEVTAGSAPQGIKPGNTQAAGQLSPAKPAAMFVASKQLIPRRKPLQPVCPAKQAVLPVKRPALPALEPPVQPCHQATRQPVAAQKHRSGIRHKCELSSSILKLLVV